MGRRVGKRSTIPAYNSQVHAVMAATGGVFVLIIDVTISISIYTNNA